MFNVRKLLAALLLPLVVLTAVSTVMLWPDHRRHDAPASLGVAVPLVNGTVTRIDSAACNGDPSANVCNTVSFNLSTGPDKGKSSTAYVQAGPGSPTLHVGDRIVLGRTANDDGTATYYFSDFQRKPQLVWLGLAFAAVVVLIGRWRGVGALVGLALTWLVVTNFLLPAVLEGKSPVLLAVTSASLIVLVVLYLAHGFTVRTTTALVGTLLGLLLTGGLSALAVDLANITGLSSDDVTSVQNYAGQVDIHGLLLAGIVIGALGVLNDVTVTQASAVFELRAANPTATRSAVYKAGMRVGRDHVASTVYTLVLAYVGAALPLLVVFALADRSWSDVAGTDVVGEEIVRTVAGAIGLMLAVPITTALAAFVAGDRVERDTTASVGEPQHVENSTTQAATDHVAPPPNPIDVTNAVDESIDTDNRTILDEQQTGQINIAAYPPVQQKRRFLRRAQTTAFERRMSRRERKFWEG